MIQNAIENIHLEDGIHVARWHANLRYEQVIAAQKDDLTVALANGETRFVLIIDPQGYQFVDLNFSQIRSLIRDESEIIIARIVVDDRPMMRILTRSFATVLNVPIYLVPTFDEAVEKAREIYQHDMQKV